jgi:hypothetical protein
VNQIGGLLAHAAFLTESGEDALVQSALRDQLLKRSLGSADTLTAESENSLF